MIGRLVVVLAVLSLLLGVVAFALSHIGLTVIFCGGALGYAIWRRRAGG